MKWLRTNLNFIVVASVFVTGVVIMKSKKKIFLLTDYLLDYIDIFMC